MIVTSFFYSTSLGGSHLPERYIRSFRTSNPVRDVHWMELEERPTTPVPTPAAPVQISLCRAQLQGVQLGASGWGD